MTAVMVVPAVMPVPEMTVPTVRAGDGAVLKVRVVPKEVAVRPVERIDTEPAVQVEHAVHVAAFEAEE